jgi:hypothetical protein
LGILIATGIQAYIYWKQEIIMQGSLNQNERSLILGQGQLAVAARNAKTAEDTLIEMKNGGTDTHNLATAAGRQAGASETTARVTERSVKDSHDAFLQDQRAWIGVDEFRTLAFDETHGVAVDVKLINSGKTPGRNLQQCVGYRMSPTAIPGPDANDVAGIEQHCTPGQAIAPQGHIILHVGMGAAGRAANNAYERAGATDILTNFPQIKAGTKLIYFFGEIRYQDLSGSARTTKFCFFLANTTTQDLGYCDQFNDLN